LDRVIRLIKQKTDLYWSETASMISCYEFITRMICPSPFREGFMDFNKGERPGFASSSVTVAGQRRTLHGMHITGFVVTTWAIRDLRYLYCISSVVKRIIINNGLFYKHRLC
jgi:hypothetical protein